MTQQGGSGTTSDRVEAISTLSAGGRSQSQELRIAPVMTGGTSLSVWMGGATCELYCLLVGGHTESSEQNKPATVGVYRKLLELGNYRPRVDVITGTSAGGLNGAFLAAAWRYNVAAVEFARLRNTWLELADLGELLRSPAESDPPSLLKGDAYFRRQVEEVLKKWLEKGRPAKGSERPIDLLLTVTTVNPEPRQRRDDYGEPISDVNHAHRLRFTHNDITDTREEREAETWNGLTGAREGSTNWPVKLAIAARTSAGIPGVFEPSFLPTTPEDSKLSGIPNFGKNASFRDSRFAVDGGVVVNLPLGEALERVFYMSNITPVRRVVLFIRPTPLLRAAVADRSANPPDLKTTVGTVVSAPRAEALTDEVDRIQQHNQSVRRQEYARRSLLRIVTGGLVERAQSLMDDYADLRTEASVEHTTGYVTTVLDDPVLSPHDIRNALRESRRALVPASVEEGITSDDAAVNEAISEWQWGITPVEHAASIVGRLIDSASSDGWSDLGDQRLRLDRLFRLIRAMRELDRNYWSSRLESLRSQEWAAEAGGAQGSEDDGSNNHRLKRLATWAAESYALWPGNRRADRMRQLRRTFYETAELLHEVGPMLRAMDIDRDLMSELNNLAPEGESAYDVRLRLLAIHVLQQVMLGDVVSREQQVELLQVSWNAKNYLDPDRSPDAKLAGPELARLGAFLKPSWRANDWLWGRMDAASGMAEMLLSPDHIRSLDLEAAEVKGIFDSMGLESGEVDEIVTELCPNGTTAGLTSTASTTATVTRRLQTMIAQEELPIVARKVKESQREGANDLTGAEFLEAFEQRKGALSDSETVAEVVQSLKVGEETVGTELGYGLFNRIISRLVAVTVNALSGSRTGVPLAPKLLRPVRTPLHAVNAVVRTTTSATPLGKFLTALVFAAGGALIGLAMIGQQIPTTLLLIAELLIAGALIAALARTHFWWHAFWALPVSLVLILATLGHGLESFFYGPAVPVTSEIQRDSVIDLGPEGLIRLTSEVNGSQIVQDLQIPNGSITIRDDKSTIRTSDTPAAQTWKHWGVIDRWSVTRIILIASAVLAAGWAVAVDKWKKKAVPLLIATITGWLAWQWSGPQQFFSAVLTGQPADAPLWKRVPVDAAESLSSVRVGVVLLAMVLASLIVGTGIDLWVRRGIRRLKARYGRGR